MASIIKTKSVEEMLKYLPILGTILIISGNIKLLVYYKSFDVEIFPFIEFNEVLILFMQNSLSYLVLFVACITSLIVFKLNDGRELSLALKTRLAKYFLNRKLFALVVALMTGLLIYQSYRPNHSEYEAGLLIAAIIGFTYIIPIIIQEAYIGFNLTREALPTILLILIFISMVIWSFASAVNEANKVKAAISAMSKLNWKAVPSNPTESTFTLDKRRIISSCTIYMPVLLPLIRWRRCCQSDFD